MQLFAGAKQNLFCKIAKIQELRETFRRSTGFNRCTGSPGAVASPWLSFRATFACIWKPVRA